MTKCYRLFCLVFLIPFFSAANNLTIGPVTESIISGTHYLNFTISWDNSWRVTNNPNNWDAVWIFVKRRDCAAIQWHHADLSDLDADHTAGSPLLVDAYIDKKGVMIYRSLAGAGNITNVSIQIKLDAPPAGTYEYKVFGIEMVYIPQGAFYLGDGSSSTTYTFKVGNTFDPFLLTSEAALLLSPSNSNLWSTSNILGPFTLPASFPKGYNPFYCMKYEISQSQYADFLNTINQDAFLNHYDASKANVARYTITGAWPAMTATATDRACNWISIDDLLAYLDWSALSPLTELEFEKASRGNSINYPVANEFAWGGNQVTDANTITPGTDGLPTENVNDPIGIGTGLANYNNNGVLGPLRCGFAAKSNTSRFEAGATYYGLMEMSGNVFELCYNVDTSMYGRSVFFTGNHGDGELAITPNAGYANQNWPGESPLDFNTQYFSFAARGGSWNCVFGGIQLKVSDRNAYIINGSIPAPPDANGRSSAFGGRGVSRR
jgi:formylglycine-generating enzyme required for sulfatase activity